MALKRVHVIVEGKVQGVYFRTYAQAEAQKIGVAGWVRNRPDGNVEAALEGESDKVDMMIEWCKTGSPMSQISRVLVAEEKPLNEKGTFNIRY
jgi:acylphosphatase